MLLFRLELTNTESSSNSVSTPFIHPNHVIRFVSAWHLAEFYRMHQWFIKLSRSRVLPFTNYATGFLTEPLHHSSDRKWASHKTTCPLRCALQQDLWPSHHGQVGLSWSQIHFCRQALVFSAARWFQCVCVESFTSTDHCLLNSFSAFFGVSSPHLTPGVTNWLAVLVKSVRIEVRSS